MGEASFKGKKREERSNSPSAAIVAPACSSPPPMRCDAGGETTRVRVCERERARGRVASLCLCVLPSSPLLQSQRCGPHGSSDLLHQQIPVAVKTQRLRRSSTHNDDELLCSETRVTPQRVVGILSLNHTVSSPRENKSSSAFRMIFLRTINVVELNSNMKKGSRVS